MSVFNTILCKILYPNNTEAEMNDIFKPCTSFNIQEFYTKKNNNIFDVYKNPNYTNIVFVLSNNMLFYSTIAQSNYNSKIDDDDKQSKNIYYTVSKKYQFLKKNLDNPFTNIDTEIIDIFRTTQKYYRGFSRFANIWRHKRSKVQIEHDLFMTPLDRNNINVFSLFQNGKIYLFTASNLVSSINSSLTNAPNFFVEPLVLKNPYTNIPFQKSDLYNIYFFLKQSPILMPVLFHNYFLTDFNLRIFRDENENTIRNMFIKSAIRNSTPDTLFFSIIRMLQKYQPKIIIDKDFPKDSLTNIMKPYLELYYIIKYSTEEYKILDSKAKLLYKLHKLHKYNPIFGRKIIRLTREGLSKKMTKQITFNDKHIPFDEPVDTHIYQTSHLELVEANYTIENDAPETDTVEAVEAEHTSDDSTHYSQYIIITTHPSFHMTDNPLTVVADISEYDDNTSDEVIIEGSYQNEVHDSDESDSGEDI